MDIAMPAIRLLLIITVIAILILLIFCSCTQETYIIVKTNSGHTYVYYDVTLSDNIEDLYTLINKDGRVVVQFDRTSVNTIILSGNDQRGLNE